MIKIVQIMHSNINFLSLRIFDFRSFSSSLRTTKFPFRAFLCLLSMPDETEKFRPPDILLSYKFFFLLLPRLLKSFFTILHLNTISMLKVLLLFPLNFCYCFIAQSLRLALFMCQITTKNSCGVKRCLQILLSKTKHYYCYFCAYLIIHHSSLKF